MSQRTHLRQRRHAAFTLVEVMVAMAVLTMVFGGVLGGLVRAESMLASSRATVRASVLLNEKIEELRAASFEGVQALGSGAGEFLVSEGTSGSMAFAWVRTIEAAAGNPDTLVVRMAVTWSEGRMPQRIEAVTYVAHNGIVNKAAR